MCADLRRDWSSLSAALIPKLIMLACFPAPLHDGTEVSRYATADTGPTDASAFLMDLHWQRAGRTSLAPSTR